MNGFRGFWVKVDENEWLLSKNKIATKTHKKREFRIQNSEGKKKREEKIEQKIAKKAKKKNLPQRTPRTQRN